MRYLAKLLHLLAMLLLDTEYVPWWMTCMYMHITYIRTYVCQHACNPVPTIFLEHKLVSSVTSSLCRYTHAITVAACPHLYTQSRFTYGHCVTFYGVINVLCFSIAVIQASGECLREVLTSKTGSTILTKLEEEADVEALWWCRYLQPFKPQRKKKVQSTLSTALWCGQLNPLSIVVGTLGTMGKTGHCGGNVMYTA